MVDAAMLSGNTLERAAPVSSVGEHTLIAAIAERLTGGVGVEVGPGDDAAVLSSASDTVVVSTDLFVQGRHFRLDWSSGNDVGRRAAGASLSDIAAMGARPIGLVVGLVLPGDISVGWVFDLTDGLAAECARAGVAVVGGDISAGDSVVISATVLGDLSGRRAVVRSGAQPGDVVAVSGRLGWAAAGLSILSKGFKSPRVLVDAHRYPQPPYLDGPLAAAAGATAMLDVSDGLVADLGHIASASGVEIAVDTSILLVDEPVVDAAAAFNCDPLTWVLAGGDDHALAATFPADAVLPGGFRKIGEVNCASEAGPAVLIDGQVRADITGFDHFRN